MDATQKKIQDYDEACNAYEKAFNRTAPLLVLEMDLEEITALLRRCIEEGKPYRHPYPNLTEEARAFNYMQDDYKAMFGHIFPTEHVMGWSFEKMMATMRRCMKEGKPFVPPEVPEDACV